MSGQAEEIIRKEYSREEADRIMSGQNPVGPAPSNAAYVALCAFQLVAEVRRLENAGKYGHPLICPRCGRQVEDATFDHMDSGTRCRMANGKWVSADNEP